MLIVYTYVIKTFYNFHPLSKYKDIDKNLEAYTKKFGEIRFRKFLIFFIISAFLFQIILEIEMIRVAK